VTTPVALVRVPVKSMPIAVPAGISRSLAVVDSVRAWVVSAVPLRLNVPECSAVPAVIAVALAAFLMAAVTAPPSVPATVGRPVIDLTM